MSSPKHMNPTYRIFGLLFCVILAACSLALFALPKEGYSKAEKRTLAEFPALSAESLADGSFMDSLEDYLSDHFPLRSALMKVRTSLDLLLGKRESQDVFYMKDGSFAERFREPSEETSAALTGELLSFAERYGSSASLSFLLAPTAVSVCAELLPDNAPTDDQNAYMDRLFSDLSPAFSVIDVREKFQEAKENGELLYYRTDHHWTTGAAKLAASAFLASLGIEESFLFEGGTVSRTFSGSLAQKSGYTPLLYDSITLYRVPQDPEEDFLYSVSYPSSHELSASLYDAGALTGDDPYEVFFGGNHPLITISTSLAAGRRLLILKDSYANCFIPFLVPFFDSITVVDPRYYYEDLDLQIASDRITDILILYNANTLSEDSSLRMVLKNEQ